jgi:tetratricopeptide (TPR) repeat protein
MAPYENASGQENSSPERRSPHYFFPGSQDGEYAALIKAIFPSSPMSAAVVVCIVAAILLLLFTKFDHTQNLIAHYDEREDFTQVLPATLTRSMAAASASIITAPDYTQSLHYLYQQLVSNPQSDTLHYYIGVCYFEAQDAKNAVRSFKKVIRNPQSRLKQKAEYKLGLAYLQADDRLQAKAAFEKIARQPHHPYREKSALILKEKQLF